MFLLAPYLSVDGQILLPHTTLPHNNGTPCHVCRQEGESITHRRALRGQPWPGGEKASELQSFSSRSSWMMHDWLQFAIVQGREREMEWATAVMEANEHWSRVLQLHWPQLLPQGAPRSGGNGLSRIKDLDVWVCWLMRGSWLQLWEFFFPLI